MRPKNVVRRNGRPYQILKYLAAAAGVLVISTLSPAAGAHLIKAGIKSYVRKKHFERDRFLRDLKNLQERELLDYKELNDGNVKLALTTHGRKKVLLYKLDEMNLNKPARWDKKWRLIIFDIPNSQKNARDALRSKLQNLNFYPIQKSAFITPYPCENEIDFIASIFDVRRYILVLYVSRFEGEKKLKHHFGV